MKLLTQTDLAGHEDSRVRRHSAAKPSIVVMNLAESVQRALDLASGVVVNNAFDSGDSGRFDGP